MCKTIKYLVLLTILVSVSTAFPQLPSQSYDYYAKSNIANRDYDYETLIHKQKLERDATDLSRAALISFREVFDGFSPWMLNKMTDKGHSLWGSITLSLVTGITAATTSTVPFFLWSMELEKQAEAIEISPTVSAYYNDSISFLVTNDGNISAFLNRKLEKYKDAYTVNSSEFADCLMWCGMICHEAGDNVQARTLMESSRILFKDYGDGPFEGRDTINEIFYLDLQSKLALNAEVFKKAIQYSEKSSQLKREFFGEHSEVYLKSLLDLSKLHTEHLNNKQAQEYHNRGYTSYVELIKKEFCEKSESERTMYWSSVKDYIDKTLEIACLSSTSSIQGRTYDSIAAASYNALLLSKGLLLNTTVSFENYVIESENEEAIASLAFKKQLFSQNAPQSTIDSIDHAILKSLKDAGQEFNLPQLSISWKNVSRSLDPDDLAIEFFKNTNGNYGALLLKKNWDAPKIVLLKAFIKYEDKTEYLNTILRSNLFSSFTKEDAERLWAVSKTIWCDDIVKHFPSTEEGRVFFAADNELLVNGIEYLPIIRPEYFDDEVVSYHCISDIYNVYRVTSTRELATKHSYTDTTAVIYGGLLYDLDPVGQAAAGQHRENRSAEQPIPILKGTRIEADSIVSIINHSHSRAFKAIPFVGNKGTEASFKALSSTSPRIIHIGTHGFFYSDADSLMINRFELGDNPLSHSGLFLAGANRKWFGETLDKNEEDGFLTALEISSLDLRGLDLVVLSACETGKGDIRRDGVFGLQRGFKMAGANSILMSLWKVDDAATCLLMTEFYRNWISEGMTKHDALVTAKQTVRSHTEKGWDKPKYWAAFILLDAVE